MTFLPIIPASGIAGYNYLTQTRSTQEQVLRQNAQVSRDIEAVRDRLENMQTVDDLLDDQTVLRVVLSSFGLEGDLQNRGFLRQVFESDPNDAGSFANRLADQRYADIARTFNFTGSGGPNLPGAEAADTLAPSLQRLGSVDDLFEPENEALLSRALEVFDLQDVAEQEVLLKEVLKSDLSDPTSLANRIGDSRYIDFAAAFSTSEDRLPAVLRGQVSDRVAAELRQIDSAEELVSDTRLLRSVLTQFGLEDLSGNTFYLQAVLESDLSDPRSVANTASDPNLRALAEAFDFNARAAEASSIYGFAELAASRPQSLTSADALLADETLWTATLEVFGLQDVQRDQAFFKDVLTSDLFDTSSVANSQDDPRFRALSEAFDFGRQLANPTEDRTTRVERLISSVEARNAPPTNVDDFFNDAGLFLAVSNFFDLPLGEEETAYLRRVLSSDLDNPLSSANLASDPRYLRVAEAVNFQPEDTTRTYPPGFVDAVVDDYVARQFEVAVGEVDNSLRVTLAFERDFQAIVDNAGSNDARWLGVMGAPSVRLVFEAAFNLPQSFGQLDVNRQLEDLKTLSRATFGTDDLQTLLAPNQIEELQRRYLAQQTIAPGGVNPTESVVSTLLLGV